MKLTLLVLEDVRSCAQASVTFDEKLTTLIGENNTGRSTIGLGIIRALSSGAFPVDDLPYGVLTRSAITLKLTLSPEEMLDLQYNLGLRRRGESDGDDTARWFESFGGDVTFSVTQTPASALG